MSSRRLLIVDGDALKTPGMLKAFSDAGWQLEWFSLLQLQLDFMPEGAPKAVLLGPAVMVIGDDVVTDLQTRFQDVPLIGVRPRSDAPVPNGLAGTLDLQTPAERWPAALEALLPSVSAPAVSAGTSKEEWSSEDLFGDIVADLDKVRGASPAPAPPAPAPPTPPRLEVPIEPQPKPQAPLSPPRAEDPVLQVRPLPPEAPTSSSLGDELRAILGEDLTPAAPAREEEFTFGGFSGIQDPFALSKTPTPATPSAPSTPSAPPVARPVAPLPQPPNPAPAPIPPSRSLLDSLQVPILEEFGNYYLMEKIAVGGMAELFKARQRGVHDFAKIVAIKRILPHLSDNDEFVRMFIDEAKLAAQLTHPNIAQIFDLGRVSGFYYIAMEFVDGRDLRSLLRRVRDFGIPFPEPVAAFVVMKVAGALDYAHRKRGMDDRELKLVHRDVSPQNILISTEGAVKLVDFGIAKAATKSSQTVAGALKGKLLYMSPEQALGEPLDHRSDIFSLGLVLFELLTGERCFQADSEMGVLEKVRLGKVGNVRAANSRVSPAMAEILNKALQKDPAQRTSSARQMEQDLRGLLSQREDAPSEQDVADFTDTLLKGTREQLELYLATRYPAPKPVPAPAVAPVAPPAPAPALPKPVPPVPASSPFPPLPEPPPDSLVLETSGRPKWVLPVVLVVIVGLVVALWLKFIH